MSSILPDIPAVNKYYLLPGSIFCTREPYVIDTILGSCVSVFLWDQVLHFGCVNHYMLPESNDSTSSFKYGDIAIPEIIKRMKAFGSDDANIKAKVFGGSEIGDLQGAFNIGERNVALAKKLLQKEKIAIISSSLGGQRGRKIVFHTATGDVFIKYIRSTVMERKNIY